MSGRRKGLIFARGAEVWRVRWSGRGFLRDEVKIRIHCRGTFILTYMVGEEKTSPPFRMVI